LKLPETVIGHSGSKEAASSVVTKFHQKLTISKIVNLLASNLEIMVGCAVRQDNFIDKKKMFSYIKLSKA